MISAIPSPPSALAAAFKKSIHSPKADFQGLGEGLRWEGRKFCYTGRALLEKSKIQVTIFNYETHLKVTCDIYLEQKHHSGGVRAVGGLGSKNNSGTRMVKGGAEAMEGGGLL